MVRLRAATFALAVTLFGLSAHGADILLLDFWSPSCGPCMQMKPLVHSFIQANYPIREIDTSRDQQTPRQFNVDRWPCFIMLVDGQEVDRHVGAISSEELQQMFQKAKDIVIQRQRQKAPEPPGEIRLQSADASPASHGPAGMPAPKMPGQPAPNAAGPSANDAPRTDISATTDFPPNLIAATVRIRVEDPQGRSFGTGTIVDSRSGEALVVTCGHLFRESKGKGSMTVDVFEVTGSNVRLAEQVPGQLISYDLDRDVALVSIRPTRQVSVAPVAPPRTPIQRSDRVATIGCSNGQDPTLLPQRITMLDRYQGAPNIEVSGAPEEGRSGGGLFNLQGQLIGVCYAADYEGKEGLYAALDSIHEELNRLSLQDIYAKSETVGKTSSINGNGKVTGQPPVIRGQELPDSITPVAGNMPPLTETSKSAVPQNLSDSEQAAYGEIMKRAETSEVVVIVRPKTPGGQSEVITLDNVSPEFVRALEARQRSAGTATSR
jgi:S1-C subfamily serine protease